jgi:phosphomannomutase
MDRESSKTKPEAEVWPKVILGRDTRESSPRLLELMKKGISVLKVPIQELGLVTTP